MGPQNALFKIKIKVNNLYIYLTSIFDEKKKKNFVEYLTVFHFAGGTKKQYLFIFVLLEWIQKIFLQIE